MLHSQWLAQNKIVDAFKTIAPFPNQIEKSFCRCCMQSANNKTNMLFSAESNASNATYNTCATIRDRDCNTPTINIDSALQSSNGKCIERHVAMKAPLPCRFFSRAHLFLAILTHPRHNWTYTVDSLSLNQGLYITVGKSKVTQECWPDTFDNTVYLECAARGARSNTWPGSSTARPAWRLSTSDPSFGNTSQLLNMRKPPLGLTNSDWELAKAVFPAVGAPRVARTGCLPVSTPSSTASIAATAPPAPLPTTPHLWYIVKVHAIACFEFMGWACCFEQERNHLTHRKTKTEQCKRSRKLETNTKTGSNTNKKGMKTNIKTEKRKIKQNNERDHANGAQTMKR